MSLDQLWEDIFSEDTTRVHNAWDGLNAEERASVHELLGRIVEDAQRIEAQRNAAKFALSAIESNRNGAATANGDLPDGALEFARTLAHDVAHQLKATFGQIQTSVALKGDGTLVTQSDIESDHRLSEAILDRYPSHGILSEERDKIFRGQEWCWVIDPIDGTTNFTWGFPMWGVLVGLLHHGQPVLGAADFPATNEQFYAVHGQGAWLNGAPIHTATIEMDSTAGKPMLQKTHLFACCTRTLRYGRPNVPMKVRIAGTTGYDLALVAKGACVGSLDITAHVWDVAALWPLIEEAGGVVNSNLAHGLFPLTSNVDYSQLEFSVISACSRPVMALLETQLNDRFKIAT